MIQLLVADDHQIILDGFKSIFQDNQEISLVATAQNGRQVMEVAAGRPLDVIIVDINMPVLNGVEVCRHLGKKYPHIPIIALSMYKRASYIQRMMQYGAKGYLLKDDSSEEIIKAIHAVIRGELYFSSQIEPSLLLYGKSNQPEQKDLISERETEVLKLISKGLTNASISSELFISQHTAETHRKNLLAKLNAKNTADLVRIAMEKGLI
ncbi:MAG: response regulator transcription factor [Saprospiraceae bacterium]|nr:response regulator transcription factor [Saprospiraceae bacterium]